MSNKTSAVVKTNPRKAVMIGCGFVGSASVFALMQSGLFSEIVLIDADKDKAEGEAMDISHGIPFARPMKIYAGGYDDVADAAIIVVSAGAGQKPGEASIAKYENGRIYPNLQTAACMADCFGVSIDYLACGEKAAVVSVDGLTDEQINLMTELTRALRQQNKGRRGNPKSTPTPEQQELVFKLVAQFLK